MADIKALIAKQRAELDVVKYSTLDVTLGGELLTLSLEKLRPGVWDDLVGANPPRPGIEADAVLGYNANALSAAYPGVLVDGEPVDAETWREMFAVLDSMHRNNIGTVIWGINVNETLQELQELGKGRASKK